MLFSVLQVLLQVSIFVWSLYVMLLVSECNTETEGKYSFASLSSLISLFCQYVGLFPRSNYINNVSAQL